MRLSSIPPFITIGEHKDLSLITVNTIEGFKAFKIGICQNCKVPYIMLVSGLAGFGLYCCDGCSSFSDLILGEFFF